MAHRSLICKEEASEECIDLVPMPNEISQMAKVM